MIFINNSDHWQSGVNYNTQSTFKQAEQLLKTSNAFTEKETDPSTGLPILGARISHKTNVDNVSDARPFHGDSSDTESNDEHQTVHKTKTIHGDNKKRKKDTSKSQSSRQKYAKKRKHSEIPSHVKTKSNKKHKQKHKKAPRSPSETDSNTNDSSSSFSSSPDEFQDEHDVEYEGYLRQGLITDKTTLFKAKGIMSKSLLKHLYPTLHREQALDNKHNFMLQLQKIGEMEKQAVERKAKMEKTSLSTLETNKDVVYKTRIFPEHKDNLRNIIHPIRFHRLPSISIGELSRKDAKHHIDKRPVCDVDYSDINNVQHLSPKAWADVSDPSNHEISLKNYMQKSSEGNDNSSPKDIIQVKKAWAHFMLFMHRAHPAMLHYHTLNIFLTEKDWFLATKQQRGFNQATFALKFIDFVLSECANCCRNDITLPNKSKLSSLFNDFLDNYTVHNTNTTDQVKASSSSGQSSNLPKTNPNICRQFNNTTGCPRSTDPGSKFCNVKNKKLLHECNRYVNDSLCFMKPRHPAHQHDTMMAAKKEKK